MDQVKFPVINDKNLSEIRKKYLPIIKNDLLKEYIDKFQTEKGILLKRVLYGIAAKK